MGRIADALRATLKTVAESDARALRDIDQELRRVSDAERPTSPSLSCRVDAKALLGEGSFHQQTVANLKRLCKAHGITGYSKLKKAELCQVLQAKGIQAPPPPLESFSKKQLLAMLKTVLGMT